MKTLKKHGFYTWCSLEPIIDLDMSLLMFRLSFDYCDEYKIGLLSGKKFDKNDVMCFVEEIERTKQDKKVIYKESIKKYIQ